MGRHGLAKQCIRSVDGQFCCGTLHEFGEEYDLTRRINQQRILHWISSGLVRAGHLGTPCGSFSRARDQPGGPPQLRSDSNPLGLAGLRPADAEKVRVGNVLMRFTVRVLLLALQLHVAFTLENPARSRLWLCPPVLHLMRRQHVVTQIIEFCAFGTRWRKSTKFLAVWMQLDLLQQYRCLGSRRGICKFTGVPHVPLCGLHPSGVWMTKYAEPYPWPLVRRLATMFQNTAVSQIAMEFSRRL